MQHAEGTMPLVSGAGGSPGVRGVFPQEPSAFVLQILRPHGMSSQQKVFIQGITRDGRTFRPSDWAERLAGAMSSFRPGGGVGGIGAFIGYSPYCFPKVIDGVKCVIVSQELRAAEPMAWDFVMNFARDNELQVFEACLLPEGPEGPEGRGASSGPPAPSASPG